MQGPVARYLTPDRLHLQHGPIDLIIGAEAASDTDRARAFDAAIARFNTVLSGLVQELPQHRSPLTDTSPAPSDPIAQRMVQAASPFCRDHFVTPMIAVAGAVADTVLWAMTSAVPLVRAYVNNGGDIAVHLAPDQGFQIAMSDHIAGDLGRLHLRANDGIGGIATSGRHGRSLSRGIADSVTVLARDAAAADAAATLIANAVNLPDYPDICRVPANTLQPDSDLGTRLVVTQVPPLPPERVRLALETGQTLARQFQTRGLIRSAALFLQGQSSILGTGFTPTPQKELAHA